MTLKTKLFGRRVKGEPLKKLLEAMGKDKSILSSNLEGWITKKVKGKCTFVPVNDGINADLYIFRTDIESFTPRLGTLIKYRLWKEFHLTSKIPYSQLGEIK